jgi:hypothetical protein
VLQYVPLGEFDVEYLDGTTETARSNFGAIMELETTYSKVEDKKVPPGTVLVRAMWLYLRRPGESLEAWAANVHNIEPKANGATADPSPPVAGDE